MDAHDAALLATQLAMGFALAACVGLRTFLPLLAAGVLARLGYVSLGDHFEWMASTPALVVFGSAALFEILADKVPWLDHALHAAEAFVKPVAGTLIAASVLTELDPVMAITLGLIAGGTVAGAVQALRGTARVASTALTGGLGNPVLSIFDDAAATVGIVLAFVLPLLAAMIVIGLAVLLARLNFRGRRASA
jgi:hypothetical protein